MSDEVVSLRDYIDHIQIELQGQIDRRLSEQKDAATRVASELTERLGAMNEFRSAMSDVVATRLGRDVFEGYNATTESRLRRIEDRLTAIETSEASELRKREGERRDREAQQGEFSGRQQLTQSRILIIGALIAVITVIVDILISLKVH